MSVSYSSKFHGKHLSTRYFLHVSSFFSFDMVIDKELQWFSLQTTKFCLRKFSDNVLCKSMLLFLYDFLRSVFLIRVQPFICILTFKKRENIELLRIIVLKP